MRRLVLLLAVALASPTFAPANAGIYCEPTGPLPGEEPFCTVRCAMTADPRVDPSSTPPVTGLRDDPCWTQD